MNYYKNRILNICKAIEENSVCVISSEINRYYFSSFKSSDGIMILHNGKADLILDFRYYEGAQKQKRAGIIPDNCNIVYLEKPFFEYIKDALKEASSNIVYYEEDAMTVSLFNKLKNTVGQDCDYRYIQQVILSMRAVKDDFEIQKIKKAQNITDMAFEHILKFINTNATERDIATELEYFCKKNGADSMAFDTISISGEKTSIPHGVPTDTKIKKGFLTLDFGAKFDGYCSDMTRTVCIGEPNAEMKKIYAKVLEAQNAAFEAICSEVQGNKVDKAARDIIYSAGFDKCFGHSTGHGLGLEIHEMPRFAPSDTARIPENAVLSVEPGIYLEGKYGVRTEDIVKITKNGYENLTKSVKELIIL